MTIDRKISFKNINIAILVISDTRNRTNDRSGKLLSKLIIKSGHTVVDNKIVKDEKNEIRKKIKQWISDKNIQAIISTGGTGITSRDITPEVFQEFFNENPPARSLIQVSALPMGAQIEIEAVGIVE